MHVADAAARTWRLLHQVDREAVVLVLRLYQLTLSPMLGPVCRFAPSCSSYAVTAVRRYGVLHGGWLTARRLARCHPWNDGGWDPVPERPDRRPGTHPDDTAHPGARSDHDHDAATS